VGPLSLSLLLALAPPAGDADKPVMPQPEGPADAPSIIEEDDPGEAEIVDCVARTGVRRVAVRDATGSLDPRLRAFFSRAVTAELRKLRGLVVMSDEELRAALDEEAQKQVAGCADESCLSEVLEAMRADTLVLVDLSAVQDQQLISAKRVNVGSAQSRSELVRVPAALGEEAALAAAPGLVEKLFDDHELRPGQTRGISRALVERLNPPPLSPGWMTVAGVGAGVAAIVAGAAAGLGQLKDAEVQGLFEDPPADLTGAVKAADDAADLSWAVAAGAGITAGALALTTLGLWPLTDFARGEELE